ncbi:MAG: sirohydrochlorin cobaltochelatase [Methanothrix sp.]|nr:sirohydrochlorin cobaltochelatase [Methanothrix sp.]
MPMPELPGFVLAPYGTLFSSALATYDQIRKAYERIFPGSPVRLAFTSHLMIKKLKQKEGISVQSLPAALEELCDLGSESVVVQSLQIVPGGEFHQVAAMVQGLKGKSLAFSRLEIGLPLLSDLADCRKVSSLLPALCSGPASRRDPEREAVLLVGHGTGHPAGALYSLMAQVLKREHRNVFLGTMKGFSGLADLLPELKGSGVRVVRLLPFLLVAGGHAENDIFGQSHSSWKSALEREGYEVVADRRGLCQSPEIVSLFLEHTGNALEKMKNG